MGAVWGLVPGLLKAYYNVNEVIASIMMNYIGMYLVNWIVKSSKPLFNNLRNESRNVAATANIPKMGLISYSAAVQSRSPYCFPILIF